MTPVLGVDPGPMVSSWVLWDGKEVLDMGTHKNAELLTFAKPTCRRVIEMVAHYGSGMAVGMEIFETVRWIGRFEQAWLPQSEVMFRRMVRLHLCGDLLAKDGNIRQALIDRIGPTSIVTEFRGPKGGVKKKRLAGPTAGLQGGEWQALGIAVTWWDKNRQVRQEEPPGQVPGL